MSEKRRDNRGRILHNGESQRSDGRYMFKYTDNYGQSKYVYSWRLDKNDRTPSGRQRDLSLREKEKQIEADLFDQIIPQGGSLSVLDLVHKYISLKTGIRHNSEAGYNFVIKNTIYMSRHHSRNAVHKRMKRGRTGQIAAVERVSYYGFIMIGEMKKGTCISSPFFVILYFFRTSE